MVLIGGYKVTKIYKAMCVLAALFTFLSVEPPAWPPAWGQAKKTDPVQIKASDKGPSAPAQAYLVLTGQSIDEAIKNLQSGNKTQNLIGGETIGCRVFIQHEKDVSTGQAEVHDGADDVFIIMEGAAILTLGGTLDSPKQVQPGEWRAPGIAGGKEFQLRKGDVVVVPRGTPHRRSTAGQDVTLMVVKAFAPAAK